MDLHKLSANEILSSVSFVHEFTYGGEPLQNLQTIIACLDVHRGGDRIFELVKHKVKIRCFLPIVVR